MSHRLGHVALPLARLGSAGQPIELCPRLGGIDDDCSRRRLLTGLFPLLQSREEHALAALRPLEPCTDQRRPAPTEPMQRRIAGPGAFALAPIWIGKNGEQPSRN